MINERLADLGRGITLTDEVFGCFLSGSSVELFDNFLLFLNAHERKSQLFGLEGDCFASVFDLCNLSVHVDVLTGHAVALFDRSLDLSGILVFNRLGRCDAEIRGA